MALAIKSMIESFSSTKLQQFFALDRITLRKRVTKSMPAKGIDFFSWNYLSEKDKKHGPNKLATTTRYLDLHHLYGFDHMDGLESRQ
ncbi:hypothetical protein KSZ_79100 [Dictyobacter formicarum]|uniref:Uncharacterized protein n=1 Tax=Dictyobacter formicarum TaxID=2778368 RepID=A0ABQ3VWA3_9CHLR|nr:hypothetical protein KSZ_79100 [Dictyobacter formicarum]